MCFCRVMILGGALALAPVASGEIVHVPGDLPHLRAALSAARDGDEIIVADGNYAGPMNRGLDFRGKRITLRSADGPDKCIIDCQLSGRAFRFHHGELADTVLEGFTIRNGVASSGGAVLCQGGSSPTIRDCKFLHNTATGTEYADGGGALRCEASSPTVEGCWFESNRSTGPGDQCGGSVSLLDGADALLADCTFVGNQGTFGGALCNVGANPTVIRCIFRENTSTVHGGAILSLFSSNPAFTMCTFVANRAGDPLVGFGGALNSVLGTGSVTDCVFLANHAGLSGGGIQCDYSDLRVANCTFVGNSADPTGEGGGEGGAFVAADSSPEVANCTFIANLSHGAGGVCSVYGADPLIKNCTLWANSAVRGSQIGLIEVPGSGPTYATILYCTIPGAGEDEVFVAPHSAISWGPGNLLADPLVHRMPSPGADGIWGTPDDDYGDLHLLAGSPCIDAGDPNYVAAPGETDGDGDPRVLDGNGDGIALIDIGADEFLLP